MDINLHIERLVIDAVDLAPDQSDLLQKSVTSCLIHLLESNGLASNLARGGAVRQLSANSIRLNNPQPTALGNQIAQSVYGGIGNE